MTWIRCFLAFFSWTLLAGAGSGESLAQAEWNSVKRVFEKRCINCHSQHGAAKALRLDSYDATMVGSANGAVVLAGNSAKSELVRRLRGESTPRMPFLSTPLPETEIDLIIRWIDAGMPNSLHGD